MDNSIRLVSKDIRNGKLPEENIPRLFNLLAEHYDTYAGINLAMNYYVFYETYCDEEDLWSKDSISFMERMNELIRTSVLESVSGNGHEKAIQTVDALRKDIMTRMSTLTAYSDIFGLYEYVLNRVEYRFRKEITDFDDEEFAREILRYIFDTEDNVIINEKIKDIIGQLPIRITRQKYYNFLEESIRAYLGADGSALESYLYILRTCAMLSREEGMEEFYPGLWEKKEQLSRMDFKQLTQEDYEKANMLLQAATLTLETEITVLLGLQEMTNEIYTLLLCAPYAGMVSTDFADAKDAAFVIIEKINDYFINNRKEELSEEINRKLTVLEGVQEKLFELTSVMEDALYEINTNQRALAGSLMLTQELNALLRSQSLLSSSMFIDLDKENEIVIVDEDRITRETQALLQELNALFDTSDRMIVRAVIANTMNKMPVFFSNHKEVMEYVLYSLNRCTDLYEKAACYEIINEIMAE